MSTTDQATNQASEPATATAPAVPTQAGPAPAAAAPPAGPRRRRWLRVAVPFAVAVLVLIVTVVTHAIEQPDPSALTPVDSGSDGGSRLAQLLADKGIGIETVHRSPDALTSALRGNATLFVPAPALMNPAYVRVLELLPETTRVVLLAPSAYMLASGHIPVGGASTRWATKAVEPGCAMPEAQEAGEAAVYHVRYQPSPDETYLRCYQDALLSLRLGRPEVILVGASDPFRNDRIDEYGNAALATGLLSRYPRVVWLDLHGNEPPPNGSGGGTGSFGGSGGSGSSGGSNGGNGQGGGGGSGGGSSHNSSSGDSPPLPIPPQFWAVLALLVAAMLAIALAKARRLGPPVAEPLPVTVRGLETVAGRGRLYQRAKARGWALHILRTAAIRRLVAALDLGPDPAPAPATVVEALAHRTGRPTDEIDAILYGPEPATDAELLSATNELDALMHQAFPDIAKGESG
ncbi:DUF4350 domain-containing protein [Rugosimonospora africana]|uniref:DUF4350 domain-containing protein n=1 Tax=Rugosimonospora africana TaxID=556532 RepID=A0A8J3QK07_9ACTN|nr:DUF4350 domain-containing protein [Rugosimonospora africana]GIH12001.1 hypothetical protein Raf01_01730 [Rugosimonospora africana]